jgi:hypothetical protein
VLLLCVAFLTVAFIIDITIMGYGTEQWTEYSIGMVVFILRFFARWKAVGITGWAWDDFFVFIAMVCLLALDSHLTFGI